VPRPGLRVQRLLRAGIDEFPERRQRDPDEAPDPDKTDAALYDAALDKARTYAQHRRRPLFRQQRLDRRCLTGNLHLARLRRQPCRGQRESREALRDCESPLMLTVVVHHLLSRSRWSLQPGGAKNSRALLSGSRNDRPDP
jgi:hypothetical protein